MNFAKICKLGERRPEVSEPSAPVSSDQRPSAPVSAASKPSGAPESVVPPPSCPWCGKPTMWDHELLKEWGQVACYCKPCGVGVVDGDWQDGVLHWQHILNSPNRDVFEAMRKRAAMLRDVKWMDARCADVVTSGIDDDRWFVVQDEL